MAQYRGNYLYDSKITLDQIIDEKSGTTQEQRTSMWQAFWQRIDEQRLAALGSIDSRLLLNAR